MFRRISTTQSSLSAALSFAVAARRHTDSAKPHGESDNNSLYTNNAEINARNLQNKKKFGDKAERDFHRIINNEYAGYKLDFIKSSSARNDSGASPSSGASGFSSKDNRQRNSGGFAKPAEDAPKFGDSIRTSTDSGSNLFRFDNRGKNNGAFTDYLHSGGEGYARAQYSDESYGVMSSTNPNEKYANVKDPIAPQAGDMYYDKYFKTSGGLSSKQRREDRAQWADEAFEREEENRQWSAKEEESGVLGIGKQSVNKKNVQ